MFAALDQPGRRAARITLVLAGIFLGQAILYGPSLVGQKILLPLDYLTYPGTYIPQTEETANVEIQTEKTSDLVLLAEPMRRFAISELRAGRWPQWVPYQFAGAPFCWPAFSPFLLFECCAQSPVILAWGQLLAALVAGSGAYAFARSSLRTSFWPAAIAGWCYPLTGFLVLWTGYAVALPVCWLPWLLLAVEAEVGGQRAGDRGPGANLGQHLNEEHPRTLNLSGISTRFPTKLTPMGGRREDAEGRTGGDGNKSGSFFCILHSAFCILRLPLTTALVLVSGQLDVAGQVLLVSGLYGLWCWQDAFWKRWFGGPAWKALLRLTAGWALGFMLAAPAMLPLLEYSRTGERMVHRQAGHEARPPVGLKVLPQVVLPDMYGASEQGNVRFSDHNQSESTAAAYAGVLATLLMAPLAACRRQQRSRNLFWIFLAVFSLSWSLNVPGFVQLLRLPGLNMMSHNRLVFGAGFAILALATTGLAALLQGEVQWRSWFWVPCGLLIGLCGWCVYRGLVLPVELREWLPGMIRAGRPAEWIRSLDQVARAQADFLAKYRAAAFVSGIGVLLWLLVWLAGRRRLRLFGVMGGLLLVELLWFGFGRTSQCEPALYYPRIPVLEEVAAAKPGRFIGMDCLRPALSTICGLRDVRGYDAVDPARTVELLMQGMLSQSNLFEYARTQRAVPRLSASSDGLALLSPVLDLLGTRYVVLHGPHPARLRPVFTGTDYWVLENTNALPRAFVPSRVELAEDDALRLKKLGAAEFNPRAVAYVETPLSLPAVCRGEVALVEEVPTRVLLSAQMQTAGLVVLADQWTAGWRAYLDGKKVPILRVDHALRGVVVPAGEARLEFRYEPASFSWGFKLAGMALLVLLGWTFASGLMAAGRTS